MAGEARSIDFLVGTATIMLGLPADLRDFRPETHSIGLVKNVKLMAEATYIELTPGTTWASLLPMWVQPLLLLLKISHQQVVS